DPDGDGDPSEDDPTLFAVANGTISGNVYVDADDDGVLDPGELAIPDVEIVLTGTDIYGDPVMLTTTTDANGYYEFTGLFPGDYVITQTHPDDFLDGQDTPGNLGGTSTSNDVIHVPLSASSGFMGESYNFGELGINPLSAGKEDFLASAGAAGGGPVPPISASESYVAPLSIIESGDRVEITAAVDNQAVEILAGLDVHRVIIDGVAYDYDAASVNTIRIDASGATEVTVRGTTLDDRADMMVGNVKLTSDLYGITVNNADQVRVYGGGGNDQAFLVDSTGDDIFVGSAAFAMMRDVASSYRHEAFGFNTLTGNAILGGNDRAVLYDTAGNDLLFASPTFSRLQVGTIDLRANRFEQFEARATTGGIDRAFLYDSDGDDRFTSRPDTSIMSGDSFRNVATGFEWVGGFSRQGGDDRAELHDSTGDDLFAARANQAFMRGDGFENRAFGFHHVVGVAQAGGNDIAELFDTAGNDTFVGRADYSLLQNSELHHRAVGFEVVSGYALSGGTDAAILHDGTGNDTLIARGNYAELRGQDFRNRVVGFDSLVAIADSGGDDRAILQSTSGIDRLASSGTRTVFSGSEYRNTADHFEMVYALSDGGGDQAELTGLRSTDSLQGRAAMAHLSGSDRNLMLNGFARVSARTEENQTVTADVHNIDYIFDQLGDWNNI
ncbi:MAG: SdrD B-like domain-containing protein, partial [Planctomycetota bacterium]